MDPAVSFFINLFFCIFFLCRGVSRYREGETGWATALLTVSVLMGVCAVLRATQAW